jgi:hypothetical protein
MSDEEFIAYMRAGLKGVTPGPWHVVIDDDGNPLSGRPSVSASDELDCSIVHWDGFVQEYWRSARGDKEIQANARHIARCSPDNIARLLDIIDRAQKNGAPVVRDAPTSAYQLAYNMAKEQIKQRDERLRDDK